MTTDDYLTKRSNGTEPAIELAHHAQVFRDAQGIGGFWAECVCGWQSDPQPDDVAAGAAAWDHYEVAVGPTDPTDVAINALLDLQDDVAGLVVWLADNWHAGMPAAQTREHTHHGDDPFLLEVTVQCDHLGELTAVAGTLGEPVLRDESFDCEDCGAYWYAGRCFGRVRLEAWCYARADR